MKQGKKLKRRKHQKHFTIKYSKLCNQKKKNIQILRIQAEYICKSHDISKDSKEKLNQNLRKILLK